MVPGYRDVRQLGEGRTGRVFLSTYEATGAHVAIKYLNATLRRDDAFMTRFAEDAASLVELDDPGAVRTYEYVETANRAAVVTELVDGVSLRAVLAEHGRVSPEAALALLKAVLGGLAAAHERGVPHRDVKPGNVLVQADGTSKLTDFGIVVHAEEPGVPAGTPAYMSPELWTRGDAGQPADLYAAACVLFEAVRGRPPYRGGDVPELRDRHLVEPLPLEVAPDALRNLLRRGLAKDPAARFASARQFAAELERDAVTGYGPEWHQRGRRHLAELATLLALHFPLADSTSDAGPRSRPTAPSSTNPPPESADPQPGGRSQRNADSPSGPSAGSRSQRSARGRSLLGGGSRVGVWVAAWFGGRAARTDAGRGAAALQGQAGRRRLPGVPTYVWLAGATVAAVAVTVLMTEGQVPSGVVLLPPAGTPSAQGPSGTPGSRDPSDAPTAQDPTAQDPGAQDPTAQVPATPDPGGTASPARPRTTPRPGEPSATVTTGRPSGAPTTARPRSEPPAVRAAGVTAWDGSAGSVRVLADGPGPVRLRIAYLRREDGGEAREVGRETRTLTGRTEYAAAVAHTPAAVPCGRRAHLAILAMTEPAAANGPQISEVAVDGPPCPTQRATPTPAGPSPATVRPSPGSSPYVAAARPLPRRPL